MFLIRFLFKLVFLCLLLVAGVSAYLYWQYKPLIDFAWKPEAYGALPGKVTAAAPAAENYRTTKEKWGSPRTTDARNLSVRKEQLNQVMGETRPPARQDQDYGITGEAKPDPKWIGFLRGKVAWARGKLNEASVKLNTAHPEDPQKQAKVTQAKDLVPKAHNLLNRADSWLTYLSSKLG